MNFTLLKTEWFIDMFVDALNHSGHKSRKLDLWILLKRFHHFPGWLPHLCCCCGGDWWWIFSQTHMTKVLLLKKNLWVQLPRFKLMERFDLSLMQLNHSCASDWVMLVGMKAAQHEVVQPSVTDLQVAKLTQAYSTTHKPLWDLEETQKTFPNSYWTPSLKSLAVADEE